MWKFTISDVDRPQVTDNKTGKMNSSFYELCASLFIAITGECGWKVRE